MGINTSCPCTTNLNEFEDNETPPPNISGQYHDNINLIKNGIFPMKEILFTQKAKSQLKQTKLYIIPVKLLDAFFHSGNLLAINDSHKQFYEKATICNYINSSSYATVLLQSETGKEDLPKYYFSRQKTYSNVYQVSFFNIVSDDVPILQKQIENDIEIMNQKDYDLIGVIALGESEYNFLYKQKRMIDINDKKCSYFIDVFETTNRVINTQEIESMIGKNKGYQFICFMQYAYPTSAKSAFFFIFKKDLIYSINDYPLTYVKEFTREQMPTEVFLRNITEKLNISNVTSSFGSVDCIYYTYQKSTLH